MSCDCAGDPRFDSEWGWSTAFRRCMRNISIFLRPAKAGTPTCCKSPSLADRHWVRVRVFLRGFWHARGVLSFALAVMFTLTAVSARAADADPLCRDTESCLHLVETKQAATEVMSARFEQSKQLSLMTEPLVSRGRFAFRRPDRVLWEVEEPKLTIRIDGKGLHLPDLPGVKEEGAALAPFGQMLRDLSGLFTGSLAGLRRGFEVEAVAAAEGVDLRLRPKTEQWRRMFTAVSVSFRGAELTIASLRLQEALGDRLEIVFSDVHRNDAVAAAAMPTSP